LEELFTIEEQENYQLERECLQKLTDSKETFEEKLNRLRGEFYEKYIMSKEEKRLSEDECKLIRMVFEHIEENWD
jgi:hypothetical protein